jgi:drug/metabolite transporter (DMT)-like permease
LFKNASPHLKAVLQALFVTFLWSTSWILIKIGLEDIPALTFAGLRYTIAFLVLLPFAVHSGGLNDLRKISRNTWIQLVTLGILLYSVTQGAQFLSLFYLPTVYSSLLLSFTSILVAFLGIFLLAERPGWLHWGGAILYIIGVLIFFYPLSFPTSQVLGLVIAGLGVLANAFSSVLGRNINRKEVLDPVAVTVVSMGFGSIVLLATGIIIQGMPKLSWSNWAMVFWLAIVNSAIAFTLWNRTLRTLRAMESSIINNTMLFQIALLAWVFLGEALSWQQILGISLAALATIMVQVRRQESLPETKV